MNIEVRTYRHEDVPAMTAIWNQVVEDGIAFPQETLLDDVSGPAFFAEQTRLCCGCGYGHGRSVWTLHPSSEQYRTMRPPCQRQLCSIKGQTGISYRRKAGSPLLTTRKRIWFPCHAI